MAGHDGNGACSPAKPPALALVDGRGEVVRLTESFRVGFAPEGTPHLSIWDFLPDPKQRSQLGRVLEGKLLRTELALPSPVGSIAAEAEAVLDAAVMRHALLTVALDAPDPEPQAGAEVLLADPSLDDSPAIVWIKDLDGRYLRINRRYSELLGIEDPSIRGKTDAELAPAQVVDGPRRLGAGRAAAEPVQLEYTVDAFEGREALTVLRFPLHGRDGAAVAVCGVAAATADAGTARSEAERLLRIERWAALSAAAIRAELIEEWQLDELAADPPPEPPPAAAGDPASGHGAAAASGAAELERLRRELEVARVAIADLEASLHEERGARAQVEGRLAEEGVRGEQLREALAAANSHADAITGGASADRERLAELEAALEAVTARAERAEGELAAMRARTEGEVAALRTRAERAEGELTALRTRPAQAEGELAALRTRAERAEAGLVAVQARAESAGGELFAVRARAQSAERDLKAGRAGEEAAQRDTASARARAKAAEHELAAMRAWAEGAERELGSTRARVDELERAQAAAAGAVEAGDAERTARAELERHAAEAHHRAEEAEATVARLRAAGEQSSAAAAGAEADADLARGRVAELEAALADVREAEAAERSALEQARAEIAVVQGALERARAEAAAARDELERARIEAEAARAAAREAEERLDQERRELGEHPPAAPAVAPALAPPQSGLLVGAPAAGGGPSSSGPRWSSGAQRVLTAALADATEWRTGLKDALRVLGPEGGWDAAVAWCPDERGRALRCVAMWMAAPGEHALFETATWQRRQSPTSSHAGRAADDGATSFVDLGSVRDPQLEAAAGEGMRSALLVPIRHGEATSGVLELLTRAEGTVDRELVPAMEAIALQLGHFDHLLRRGAEPHWRLGRL